MKKSTTLKVTSLVTVLAAAGALITASNVHAADHASVLERISQSNKAPVNYTLGGKSQAQSDFRNGILTSAVTGQKSKTDKVAEYKVRYTAPIATVLTRSEFRNNLLKSATSEPAAQAEFARMELIDE